MRKKSLSIFLFVIFLSQLFAQENNQAISDILIFGNRKTKEEFIRRTLNLKKGQAYDPEIVEKSRKKLFNLKIFSVVEVETRKTEEGVDLWIFVKERPPLFFEQISDYCNETYSYFLGFKMGYKNLWGKNQELWLAAAVGNLKKLEFGYQNNYFANFFWGLSLGNSWYKNYFYDFKESRFTGKIFAGRKASPFEAQIWADYEKIEINMGPSFDQAPGELFKSGLNISYDSKDWKIFPSKGIFAQAGFYKAFSGNMRTVYDRYLFEISSFFNLWKRNVLALDLRSTVSEGNVPLYDRLFFGGVNTLRGFSVGTYSGNNSVVFTSEYRIPVSSKRDPWEKTTSGSTLYLFSDIGSITERKEDFRLKDFKSNFGIGLFWALMEDSKLRIDMSLIPKVKFVVSSDWKF